MTIASIMKVTRKVDICSYANNMVLTATMAEYKLEAAYSTLSYIMGIRIVGWLLNLAKLKLLLSQ